MIEEPAKPFFSNIAMSDVFVPVDMRPEWGFGIVGVDHPNVIDAENTVQIGDGFLDARGGGDIVAGCVAVASIDAEADFEIGEFRGERPAALVNPKIYA